MKYKTLILFILCVFLCTGIFVITHSRFQASGQTMDRQIRLRGQTLIKIISLAYEGGRDEKEKNLVFKEIAQMTSNREIDYLLIHDYETGAALIALPSDNPDKNIPDEVRTVSLAGIGPQVQEFTAGDGNAYIEFSNPVFRQGQPDVMIRMGMQLGTGSFFAMKNFTQPFQILFFVITALVLAYYWLVLQLKPILKTHAESDLGYPLGNRNVQDMILQLNGCLERASEKTADATRKTLELTAETKILQYENHQLHSIFNCLDFGILLIDMQDTIFFINDYFLRLLEKDRTALVDSSIFEAWHHQGLVSFVQQQNLMDPYANKGQTEICFDAQRPEQVFLLTAIRLTDPDGTMFGRLFKLVDISREKVSEKSQKDFINHIAHELRTPLTNIKAYNEMMMEGEINDVEMQKEFFNTINDETNRLSSLIKNILNLAETEMGHLVLKKDLVKTQWLFQSCMDSAEAMAQEKNIVLNVHLPDNLPNLSGDKEMLKSALINVLGNAIKYTPESGSVDFMIRETPDSVVFEIADTGYGISADDLPHIFDKFFRSENDQITGQTGSGLGLSITAEIVKIHGGTIDVDSEPGRGSRFTLSIPKGDVGIG